MLAGLFERIGDADRDAVVVVTAAIGEGVAVARVDEGGVVVDQIVLERDDAAGRVLVIVEDLRAVGYTGYVSLEEFGPDDDEEKVKSQGAYLKALAGDWGIG